MEEKNIVVLSGRLASKYDYGTGKGAAIIVTEGQGKNAVNFPRINFSGDNLKVLSTMERNDYVKVVARFRSRIVTKPDNTTSVRSYLEAVSIAPAQSVMEDEFGVKGRLFVDYMNKAALSGTVKSVRTISPKVVHLLVEQENPKVTVIVTIFTNAADETAKEYAVGDHVKLVGVVQTARTEKEGNKINYINFVASDIVKE